MRRISPSFSQISKSGTFWKVLKNRPPVLCLCTTWFWRFSIDFKYILSKALSKSGTTGVPLFDRPLLKKYLKSIENWTKTIRNDKMAIWHTASSVSYTHLRDHETKANIVCRLLLEKKKNFTKVSLSFFNPLSIFFPFSQSLRLF